MTTIAIPDAPAPVPNHAKARWDELFKYKSTALDSARACAALTFPYLVSDTDTWMKENNIGFAINTSPRGAMSGRAVSTLASKLSGTLFPQTKSFFRLEVVQFAKFKVNDPNGSGERVTAEMSDPQRKELEQYLLRVVDWIFGELVSRGIPQAVEEGERHSIVCGFGLLHVPAKRKARIFRFDQFVVDMDGHGHLLELIVRQQLTWRTLPNKARLALQNKYADRPQALLDSLTFEYFTVIRREIDSDEISETGNFVEYQECDGVEVPGTRTEYGPTRRLKRVPWILIPWRRVADGVYPVSLVHERFAMHAQHEGLSFSLQMLSAMASDRKRLVKPGITDIDELRESAPGDYVKGDPKDVSDTTLGDVHDVRWLTELNAATIGMMQTSYGIYDVNSVSPVERRTALEASMLAHELNASNQGVYSLHTELVQKPILELLLDEALLIEDLIPDALKELRDSIRPRIIAGLDALGRDDESQSWAKFFALITQAQQSGFTSYANKSLLYRTLAIVAGVDVNGIIFDEERIAQFDKAAAMMEYTKQVPGAVARNATQQEPTANA